MILLARAALFMLQPSVHLRGLRLILFRRRVFCFDPVVYLI